MISSEVISAHDYKYKKNVIQSRGGLILQEQSPGLDNLLSQHECQDPAILAAATKLQNALTKQGSLSSPNSKVITSDQLFLDLHSIGERDKEGKIPRNICSNVAEAVQKDMHKKYNSDNSESEKRHLESLKMDFLRNNYFMDGELVSGVRREDCPSEKTWQAAKESRFNDFCVRLSSLSKDDRWFIMSAAHQGTLFPYSTAEVQLGRLVHEHGAQLSSQGIKDKEDTEFHIHVGNGSDNTYVELKYLRNISGAATYLSKRDKDNPLLDVNNYDYEKTMKPTCRASNLKCEMKISFNKDKDSVEVQGRHSLKIKYPTQAALLLDKMVNMIGHGTPVENTIEAMQGYAVNNNKLFQQAKPDNPDQVTRVQRESHNNAIVELAEYYNEPVEKVATKLQASLVLLNGKLINEVDYISGLISSHDLEPDAAKKIMNALTFISPFTSANQLFEVSQGFSPLQGSHADNTETPLSLKEINEVSQVSELISKSMHKAGLPVTQIEKERWNVDISNVPASLSFMLGPATSLKDAESLFDEVSALTNQHKSYPEYLMGDGVLNRALNVAQNAYNNGITTPLVSKLVHFYLNSLHHHVQQNTGNPEEVERVRNVVLSISPLQMFPADESWQPVHRQYGQLLSSVLYTKPTGSNNLKLQTFTSDDRERIGDLARSLNNVEVKPQWMSVLPNSGIFQYKVGSAANEFFNYPVEQVSPDFVHVAFQCSNAIVAEIIKRDAPQNLQMPPEQEAGSSRQGRLLGGSRKASEAPSGSHGCSAQGKTDSHLPGQGPDDEGSAGAANIITQSTTQESPLETSTGANKRHLSEAEFKGVIKTLKKLCLDNDSIPLLEALAPIEQLSHQQQQQVAITLLPLLAQKLDNLGYRKNPGPGVGGAISSLLAVMNNMSIEHKQLSQLLYGKNASDKSFSSMLAPYLLYPDFNTAGHQLLHLTNNLVSRQGSPLISTTDIQAVQKAIKKQPIGNEKFRDKLLGDYSNFNKAILGKGSVRSQRELTVPINLSPTSIVVKAGQAQLEVDHKVRLDNIKRQDQLNSPDYLYQEKIFNRMESERAEKKDSWKRDLANIAIRTQSALEQLEIDYRNKNTLKRNTAEIQEKSARVSRDQSKAIKKETLRTQSALSATYTSRAILAQDKARNDEMKSIKAERSNIAYSGAIESRRNAIEAIPLQADALKNSLMPVHSTNIHQKSGNQALTPFSPVISVPVAARTVTNQYVPAYLKFEPDDVTIKADIPNAHGTLLAAESITRHGSISTVTLKTPDNKHVEFSGTFKNLNMETRAGNSNLLSSEWDKGKTNFVTGLSAKLRTPLEQSVSAMNAQDMKHFNDANDLKNQRLKQKASIYAESTLQRLTIPRPRGYNQPVDTTPMNYKKTVETAPKKKHVNEKVTNTGGTAPGDENSKVGAVAGRATPVNGRAQSTERAIFAPLSLNNLIELGQEPHLVGGNTRNRR